MAACPACGKENPDGFQFCGFCTAPLTGDTREQRKTVTVLFCDVTGSTALGESTDPEALRAVLARYFERMRGIVESHGGRLWATDNIPRGANFHLVLARGEPQGLSPAMVR